MLEFIRQIPADYFLHYFGAGILFLHFRHIYNFKIATLIIAAISIIKEVYDMIYKPWSGFSFRDILMNALGVLTVWLILYAIDEYNQRKRHKRRQRGYRFIKN